MTISIRSDVMFFLEMNLDLDAVGLILVIYAYGQDGMEKCHLDNIGELNSALDKLLDFGIVEWSKRGDRLYIRYSVFDQTMNEYVNSLKEKT